MSHLHTVKDFRKLIEELIVIFSSDNFSLDHKQIDFFQYYNEKIKSLNSIDLKHCLSKVDRLGYNKILINNIIDNLNYFKEILENRKQTIEFLHFNIDKLYENYVSFNYPLIEGVNTKEVSQVNEIKLKYRNIQRREMSSKFPFPYSKMNEIINLSLDVIKKYYESFDKVSFFSKEISDRLYKQYFNPIIFSNTRLDSFEFYNFINLRPVNVCFSFRNETAKINFVKTLVEQVKEQYKFDWQIKICKSIGLDNTYYNKNKHKNSKSWNKFISSL